MAIDTAAKRASVLGFALVPLLLVPPDGVIDQGDRQTLLHLYSGVLAGAPPAVSPATFVIGSVVIFPILDATLDVRPILDGSVKMNGGDT
jgi:hypothetical protein